MTMTITHFRVKCFNEGLVIGSYDTQKNRLESSEYGSCNINTPQDPLVSGPAEYTNIRILVAVLYSSLLV